MAQAQRADSPVLDTALTVAGYSSDYPLRSEA